MFKIVATLVLLLYGTVLAAAPAPWYWWVSKVDGSRTCSQYSLGPGWEQIQRPYKDSRCEKPALAK
jgi:hypothetical protein